MTKTDTGAQAALPTIGIAAVLKQEAPYLLEWIAYHRVLGIKRFFLADNGGSDRTSRTLGLLHAAGIVTRVPWPTPADGQIQMGAYRELLRRFKKRVTWLAFLDGDEFILPSAPHRSIHDVIGAVAKDDTGAIALNWALYGSSGLIERDDRLVIERFTSRAPQENRINNHTKIIVRGRRVKGMRNPHYVSLREGFGAIDSEGNPLVQRPQAPAQSTAVVWGAARLNHYAVKSRQEFESKKARGRGKASVPQREDVYFLSHDRNDISDPVPEWLLQATRQEVAALERKIRRVPLLTRLWLTIRLRPGSLKQIVPPARS